MSENENTTYQNFYCENSIQRKFITVTPTFKKKKALKSLKQD